MIPSRLKTQFEVLETEVELESISTKKLLVLFTKITLTQTWDNGESRFMVE